MTDEIDKQDDVIDEIDENDDDINWKELALKNQGIVKRKETKLSKIQKEFDEYKKENPIKPPEKPEAKDKPSESDFKFNSGDKALLKAYNLDIKDLAQIALAENWMKRTGDTIETMMTDDAFQSKLKGLLDVKAAKEAVPPSDRRGAQSNAKDTVEYWVGRNDLPDDLTLRRKVVNARIAREKSASNNPDVGGVMHNLSGSGFEIR